MSIQLLGEYLFSPPKKENEPVLGSFREGVDQQPGQVLSSQSLLNKSLV